MVARLLAISGPLEGAVFPLEAELSIGREKTNTIPIEDRVLSRRHCLIQKDNGHFNIRDLNSSNGTYVSGLPVAAHVLKDGDQIKAGQSLFLFIPTKWSRLWLRCRWNSRAATPWRRQRYSSK